RVLFRSSAERCSAVIEGCGAGRASTVAPTLVPVLTLVRVRRVRCRAAPAVARPALTLPAVARPAPASGSARPVSAAVVAPCCPAGPVRHPAYRVTSPASVAMSFMTGPDRADTVGEADTTVRNFRVRSHRYSRTTAEDTAAP